MSREVTIIIPVYNGEMYISRCIESILNQTFGRDKLEILVIDDGSTDKSGAIVDNYKANFPQQVTLLTKENSGVADSRNLGIKLSNTKYTIFVDQDDYLEPEYCRTLYDAAESGDYDLVFCGYQRPDNNNRIVQRHIMYDKEIYNYTAISAWAKIFNTEFLQNNDVIFENINIGEDIIFMLRIFNLNPKVLRIKYVGYNWFMNYESVSNTSQKGLQSGIEIVQLFNKTCELDTTNNKIRQYFALRWVLSYLLTSGRLSSSSRFVEVYHELYSVMEDYCSKITKRLFIREIFSFRDNRSIFISIAVSTFQLLHKVHLVGLFAKLYCRGKHEI